MFYSMKDIYSVIDEWLLLSGYWDLDAEAKREAIDRALREYLSREICAYDISGGATIQALVMQTPETLMEGLENLVDSKYHFETLRHVVHYVINVASNIQEYTIIWQVSEDDSHIKHPEVSYNQDGKWDNFITHKYTKYSDAFKVAYEALQQNMTLKK